MSRDAIAERVEALGPWFHNLYLDGVWTAPGHFLGDFPGIMWRRFRDALPEDLDGRSVLDIGCNSGFYCAEMKRRGAGRVVGIDSDPFYLEQARFAAEVLGHDSEFHEMSVYDVGALGERFDIVLFMGVAYHLRHPLLALDLLWEHVADDVLVFQSMQRGSRDVLEPAADMDFFDTAAFDEPGWPKLHFIENRYAGDPTNWWAPNGACTQAMLRSAGFRPFSQPEKEVFVCRRVARAEGAEPVYPARSPHDATTARQSKERAA
ncbi:TIGR04290 family methyltransferase [Salinarimonas chemoclinalis]|uniref:TIGR04290 family methyltransferase n=1 Tax=Salinarimonas chemoclinalis TaxID=3241599 RepID=UPI0035565142